MNWYVLHTRPRSEKKAEEQLLSMGINAYCPTRSEIKQWSDRKKKIDIPVLPSMVLVKIKDIDINRVFESTAVVRYMFWLGKRAIVRDKEVDILKKYLNGDRLIGQETFKFKPGDIIEIPGFDNGSGLVDRVSKHNAWIFLENAGYTIKLNLA